MRRNATSVSPYIICEYFTKTQIDNGLTTKTFLKHISSYPNENS